MEYFKKLDNFFNIESSEMEIVDDINVSEFLSLSGVMFGKLNPMSNPIIKDAHAIRMKELSENPEWKSKLMMAIRTDEYREKMRQIVTGRKHSEETKRKMSEIAKRVGTGKFNLGVPKTNEHKENMKNVALKRERISCCKCGKGFTKANLQKHENSCNKNRNETI
ncbi:MAG: hypothetical protein EBT27_12415 [Betaproteobacteria bacterium]|nr:hypothetical protein [Betaproteobacteria bacterium]